MDAPTTVLPTVKARPDRIPEIDGLRGVAIALIVLYHVWLNRVSGGVDVFFLLSGFLITMSLLRSVERHGRIHFGAFYARIARRIVPPALTVLVGVVVATIAFLPQVRWRDTVGDVIASAFYWVNWHLAANSVDYLASQYSASPVQHYWSLAVQTQFYLLWPLLVIAAAVIATQLALRPRRVLAVVLGTVFVVSLAYSVHRTAADQVFTYFDSVARLWEFALGGLLLLAAPYLRVRHPVGMALGWLGMLAFAACGLIFRGGDEFPGWAALWPTLAAALLIVTAGNPHPASASRVLRSDVLRRLGDLSYSLYLVHWPVLICYFAISGRTSASLRGGALVIALSLLLAAGTKWLTEDKLRSSGIGQRSTRGGFAMAATFLVAVLLATGGWTGLMHRQQQQLEQTVQQTQAQADAQRGRPDSVPDTPYPGAAHVAYGGELPDVPYQPGPLQARGDRPSLAHPGCQQDLRDSEVLVCEVGPPDGDRTIAVVGSSHAHHWLPALGRAAELHGWRILGMTKAGCLFSTEPQDKSCDQWNHNVIKELAQRRPDAVFTTATRVTRAPEEVPDGYVNQWRTLDSLGIPVIGIRDTPRPWRDVPECVEINTPDSPECGGPPGLYGLDGPSELTRRADLPDNLLPLDLTGYFCPDGFCPAVIGNVLVYHDDSHISVTYAHTLAPFLADAIIDATGWKARPVTG